MKPLKCAKNGVAGDRAKVTLDGGASHEPALPTAEDGFVGRTMVEGSGAEVDDRVPLASGAEMLQPSLPGELAAGSTAGSIRFKELGEASDVFFGDAKKESIPIDVWREQVTVGDEHRSDAGAHHFEQANAAGSGSAGAQDEVGLCEGFGVLALAVFASGLAEIPMKVGGGVLDADVGATPIEIEEAFAQHRGAAASEGEEERLRGRGSGLDEWIAESAVVRNVAVAKGAPIAAALVNLSGAVNAGQ